ncbi:hypothetical protein HRG_006206 [Hirsutella rhossiliensis]|uniref:Uncharacterized protein n=1 Tax=Hirsutella rhossiliensis TaxID=111463 RepID=A0A9P8SK34_9HYPO|nr:uncharacterized protein HRG_06206 [Hirsutella rhossiliensis]KAH0963696.1 hypothetical protein HRG_06206 [Hirsutella rhossiliensis]
MLSKNTLLAIIGVLTALHSATAQGAAPADEIQQLPADLQELANEKCHPGGTYKLGDETSVIPPCVAEQLIFTECEGRAGFISTEGARLPPGNQNMDIYKECVLGKNSTLNADSDGCLACKKSNEIFSDDEAKFWKNVYSEAATKLTESNDTKTLPELYEELRLQSNEFPQPLQENKNVTVPLEEYYPNPPKPQRAGDSEALEEQDVAGEQGQGPVKRQVKVRAQFAAFASASFGCQRPGFGSFTPAMVQKPPKGGTPSSASSAPSAVPTTLIRAVPSAVPSTNKTDAANNTVTKGTNTTNDTRIPSGLVGINGTRVTNGTSPQPTSPTAKAPVDRTFIFVMVFTPSQHVMKRQQDGSYVYVIMFGKPAPIADSPETPQKPLGSREEGEKRGLPDISQCGECARKQVTLPGVVQAEAAPPSTQQADGASQQVLEKVESAVQQSGAQQPQTMIFVVNIGVTAGASAGAETPGAETPDTAKTNKAGKSAAGRPVSVGGQDAGPGVKGDAKGQGKVPAPPGVPAGQPGSQPPRGTQTATGTPQATPPSGNSC